MNKRFSKDFWLRVFLFGLFIFALYSNVLLIARNHSLGQILTAKKTETAARVFDNQKLKLLITYYQTASYQEVEARRRLQLKKPDETVYAIKGLTAPGDPNTLANPGMNPSASLSDSLYPNLKPSPPTVKTNIQLWWEYFFN